MTELETFADAIRLQLNAAKTPGQVAYEAAPFRIRDGFEDCLVDMPYEHLSSGEKAAFDKRAEAVIRMCAAECKRVGEEECVSPYSSGAFISERALLDLIPAKNGGEG